MPKLKTIARLFTEQSKDSDVDTLSVSFDFVSMDELTSFGYNNNLTFAKDDELPSNKLGIRQLIVRVPMKALNDSIISDLAAESEWVMESDAPTSKGTKQFNKTVTMIRNKASSFANHHAS